MRRALLILLLCSLPRGGWGSSGEEPEGRRPLDLPSGGRGTADSEDVTETIHFLGGWYEGDGFFFLLDVSGSMFGDKLAGLKAELRSTITEMSSRSEFGLVSFSAGTKVFESRPLRATSANKTRAVRWVEHLEAFGATWMLDGAREILTIAHRSKRHRRIIIAVGDGLPTVPNPDDTLIGILGANTQRLRWNTILLGVETQAVEFMTALASATRGTFYHRSNERQR